MKAQNLRVGITFWLNTEPDNTNRTAVWLYRDNESSQVWPRDVKGDVTPERGDTLSVSVPSGMLLGRVLNVAGDTNGELAITLRPAQWEGKAGGLAGGLCACGKWDVYNQALGSVVSSAYPEPVDYYHYEQVRQFADLAWDGGYETPPKPERMRELFDLLVDWDVDISPRQMPEVEW